MRTRYALLANAALVLLVGCSSDSGGSAPTEPTPFDSNAAGTAPSGGSTTPPATTPASGGGSTSNANPATNTEVVTTGGLTGSGTASTGSGTGAGTDDASDGSGVPASTGPQQWVATWAASPYVDANNPPPATLANSVLRQVTHTSIGGSQLRVQYSNLTGNGPVTINAAHIALCNATPAVDSTIDTSTDTALAFSGMASVTIPQGQEVWSDAVDFTFAPLANISITTAFGNVPSTLVGHFGSRTTSYLKAGSDVSAADMTGSQTTDHWFYISGMDVMADTSAVAAVAIGDSITDGRGTDTNKNNRWTDILSARLQANAPTASVAMINQGIGGTNLAGTTGTAAQARFQRDVLNLSSVRYVIVFDGVNDIGGNAQFPALQAAYDDLIKRAHDKGLLIYGATITPFGGYAMYYSTAHEMVRQQVNAYIKSGAFDGYIDFDAALTDGGNPPQLLTEYATWMQKDGLHPGPAGYQKLGDTPDLSLFSK
jgi:lysophospholipase L1-like esterase